MKPIRRITTILISLISTFTFTACEKKIQNEHIIDVTTEQATQILSEQDVVVLDVRTPKEYAKAHINNATLINFYDSHFKEQISKLDRNKKYLVYCHSGGRSSKTMKIMSELGFSKVYHLYKGARSGLPTRPSQP